MQGRRIAATALLNGCRLFLLAATAVQLTNAFGCRKQICCRHLPIELSPLSPEMMPDLEAARAQ